MKLLSSEIVMLFLMFLAVIFFIDLAVKAFNKDSLKKAFRIKSVVSTIIGALVGTIVVILLGRFF